MPNIRNSTGALACVGGLVLVICIFQPAPNTPAPGHLWDNRKRSLPGDDLGDLLVRAGYIGVPFALTQAGILDVTLRINGESFVFFIDSGATDTVLNRTVAERLQLSRRPSGQTIAGAGGTSQELEKVVLEKVSLGGSDLRFEALLDDLSVTNRTEIERGLAPHDGYLGMELLKRHRPLIDYMSHRMFLRVPQSGRPEDPDEEPSPRYVDLLKKQGYIEVPFVSTKKGLAVIEAEANGERLRFLIDTGAMVCVVDEVVTRRLELPTDGGPTQLVRGNGGAEEAAQNHVIDKFVIGGIAVRLEAFSKDLKEIHAAFVDNGDRLVDGILGSNLLRHFTSVVDYSSGTLFLKVPEPK